MTRLLIHGAAGRMGQRLIALAADSDILQTTAAVDSPQSPLLGKDAGQLAGIGPLNLPITDKTDIPCDVAIDFSVPAGCRNILQTCLDTKTPLVIGTTGLQPEDHQRIDHAASTIPILQAANMSLGVNLLITLAARVAKQLGDDYDIEITETHHRFKLDSPSGTANAIANAICNATDKDPDQTLTHGRHGTDTKRKPGQIGMHALRMGDLVGKHTVSFATLGEQLDLQHNASTRDIFARGALRAAAWLSTQKPARYTINHVLGLTD